jgi:hypothetical protein
MPVVAVTDMKELENDAQEWLARHAVLLGPEELPFEEERLEEALRARDGEWPVPCRVEHMGVFAEIEDAASFNRIVGDPRSWPIVLGRPDLYHAWIVPQAINIFGRTWFNQKQGGNWMRPGPQLPLFDDEARQSAHKAGKTMAETPAGRAAIVRIMARTEHALDKYLSGGGLAKSGGVKKPGGYIVRSIANEFIQDATADMGYRMVRARACPNCLAMRSGKARRSRIRRTQGNFYACDQCSETARNIASVLEACVRKGEPLPDRLVSEHERALRFSEFCGTVFVCPNDQCRGRFVPADSVADQGWWATSDGIEARRIIADAKAPKGVLRFREPPKGLSGLPLYCPFCDMRFAPGSASVLHTGFRGKSGMMTGLPTMFVWAAKDVPLQKADPGPQAERVLVDESSIDPAVRIMVGQRIGVLVGELAIHARRIGRGTVPSIISFCFCEAVASWMLDHPEDASGYFFDWLSKDRRPTEVELAKSPGAKTRKTTKVARGREAAIHQSILGAWLDSILGHMRQIRKVEGSGMRSLEDLKWFCRPPAYSGGPRVEFSAKVGEDLCIRYMGGLRSTKDASERPRMAKILSIRLAGAGKDMVGQIKSTEWRTIRMSEASGLKPGDPVHVSALMMPDHHCHAPIKRISRLRTDLLASIIDRVRKEEASGNSDVAFWREWQKRAEEARKETGIGIQQGVQDGRTDK